MGDGDQIPAWSDEYARLESIFQNLANEVVFALDTTTNEREIKTHSILSRVKTPESLALKARQKELDNPLDEIDDIVGIRVVVLFLSDLPRMDRLIRESFEIHDSDDKVSGGDPATFGYMSMHYVGTLASHHSGPRYDSLKGRPFEIQTRTVVMDAWANVSHYLDYKGESSVPEELRRDFLALSGLFYVADQHFEIFASRARQSSENATRQLDQPDAADLDINLDTLVAFLVKRFADREHSGRSSTSELVEELSAHGYLTIGQLAEQLDRAESAFEKYEAAFPSSDGHFADSGAVRISIALADKDYANWRYPEDAEIAEFALWA